jgi:asparagine synthase (glutamine-hydrolysing)
MCGICGVAFSTRSRRTVDAQALVRMRDTMTHRGPDDCGIFGEGRVGLAHRRLSIIDVAAGHQPMPDDTGSLHIVYNGEIYNHPELKVALERRGHRYRTRCDTETILHLYQESGSRAVEQLRGMFAFAIWDGRREELFLARDRLGEKPLYYVHTRDGSLFFASEIKALLAAGATSPELNYEALPDYLANRAPSGTATLYAGVQRLLPGHTLRWHDGEIEIRQYWDLSFGGVGDGHESDQELVAEFAERFRDAVRMRLMSDVPLGVFLSGGIDSASIAAVMSRLVAEPIKTFSVGFVERESSELAYARTVAEAYGTDHHEVVVSGDDFFNALPTLVWHEDEPMGHPASVALYFVARLARDHVKVVLTGEGSDELLAGYGRYARTLYNVRLGAPYHRVVPAGVRRAVRGAIGRLGPGSARRKLEHSFLCVPPDLESIYLDNFAVFPRALQAQLLTPAVRARVAAADPYGVARAHLDGTDAATLLDRLLYVDTKTYLHELLMKQDQMSMAASIESRVPFLDHELVEFAARLPTRLKLRGSITKRILRQSMAGTLPASILTRPKMGFPVPLAAWFRGPWRGALSELVLGERARERGIFDPDVVRRLIGEHSSGRVEHMERLWALMNFELWLRRFVDGEEEVRMPAASRGAAVVA